MQELFTNSIVSEDEEFFYSFFDFTLANLFGLLENVTIPCRFRFHLVGFYIGYLFEFAVFLWFCRIFHASFQ